MPSLERARDFVYRNGQLWERTLFGHLFDGRAVAEVHQALAAYRNPDGGFGHGLEHDIRCPASNPAQLELLLFVNRVTGLDLGPLLEGTVAWLESIQESDGSLRNPDRLADYPLAPWWAAWGGQRAPDSIVGNLARLGLASDLLRERTRRWVERNVTVEGIRKTGWLFMLYHPIDYFFGIDEHPGLDRYRSATAETLVALAEAAPEEQAGSLLGFLGHPLLAGAVPQELIARDLERLAERQQPDGGWRDEHGLAAWFPLTTIFALFQLRRFGRLP